MIPLLTRDAVRAIDADAVTRLGVPSLELMENAGRGAFEALLARFPDRLGRIAVVGGVGQNGGDAWVVARHLVLAGHTPRVVLVGGRDKVRGDAATNLLALERLGASIVEARDDVAPLAAALADATLIIDGLFGTGLDRELTGLFAVAVGHINACAAPCVALDLPSGVDANTGAVLGVAVQAELTVTFAAHKRGLHQHPGAGLAGELVCASIGVPGPRVADASLLSPEDIALLLPRRAADAHKGSAGRLLVVAGAPGRTGAALLSGLGALRAGAGLVTLCPRSGARAALDAKVIELMTIDLPLGLNEALQAIHALADDLDALVVGPGLGLDAEGRELSRRLALELTRPTVLDADALTAIGTDLSMLQRAAAVRVLTPHPGEAARLLSVSSAQVQSDRYAAALHIAQTSGCVTVLKGACSVIADPRGRMLVCPRGTPALAVAGTGDVLSGVIGALLTHLQAFDAASAGVYLHAQAGELAAHSDRGLLAREVADAIPLALEAVRAAR